LFEALLALDAGKLRVCCSAPGGYGVSEEALRQWQGRIDAIDWVLAETTRKCDDKRLRAQADRLWELQGKGIERLLAQLKKFLRREIYGQILLGAVEAGNLKAVVGLLDSGANPEQKDAFGNTVEELASSNGRPDIEEVIFERRMRGKVHCDLSAFFDPHELLNSCDDVPEDVLVPFLTEPSIEEAIYSDEDSMTQQSSGVQEDVISGEHLFRGIV